MDRIQAALTLSLADEGSPAWQQAQVDVQGQGLSWSRVFETLRLHRVDLLASSSLRRTDTWAEIPEAVRDQVDARLAEAQRGDAMFRLALQAVAGKLQAVGVEPVACKGIVMSSDYYPAPGLRPMQDIDLWVRAHEMPRVIEVMAALGFEHDGGTMFRQASATAVEFDVHDRMKLFEPSGLDIIGLSQPHGGDPYRVFEPEPLVVHLVVHMLGHVGEVGLMLGWLADLALVVRRHGPSLDWRRVESLLPADGSWRLLLRLLSTFDAFGWCPVPEGVRVAARRERPVAWETILRQRRLAAWGLPSPRGWARLALAEVSPTFRQGRAGRPRAKDLLLWPFDWLTERTPVMHGTAGALRRRVDHFVD